MVPTPAEIRALRGARSRAEFAALIGVTPLTVYRWELSPDSPELRRPRGKVLQRLQAWMQAQTPAAPARPAPPSRAPAADAAEDAALAPVLRAIEECLFEPAEAQLVGLLTSGTLRSEAARARASIALARLQLLARHDTHGAFTTLLPLGADVTRLPGPVQLEYHLAAAALHAHPDARLFNPGKTHHHAALAEPLLAEAGGDARFFLGYVQVAAAVSLYDAALIDRAMERFAAIRGLASTPLNHLLAYEVEALAHLGLTSMAEAERRMEAFLAATAKVPAPLQRLRALIWRAEVAIEQAAPPAQSLAWLEEAEALQRRHRIAPGIHAMLMNRNKGEVLLRLGRVQEAEAALLEAERYSEVLAYTPHRITTTLTRLYLYSGRLEALRALGERALRFEGLQQDLARAVGRLVLGFAEVLSGGPPPDWFDVTASSLDEFRRRGGWANAYRHVSLYAFTIAAIAGTLEQAERMLRVAERALEWSPSPTASALFRHVQGMLLVRRGRLLEARQLLEAAQATFELSEHLPEAALGRRLLASLEVLEGAADGQRRLADAEAELVRLGLAVPPLPRPEAAPPVAAPATGREGLRLEQLVVPLQRLTTRGVGASLLQKELLNVAAELLPHRALRLQEVDSSGATLELGSRGAPEGAALEDFTFSDGVGRRLRLGVGGRLEGAQRAALQVLLSCAALAFEVAGLRGFTAAPARSTEPASAAADDARLPGFVAASAPMRRLKSELARLSGSRATIIVTGESGTGKEVVARAIHDLSQRAGRPYVTFNSAAVPRELFEGQLFGYRKGAFTGATADHPGVIRAAEGGTLFLDEVGELPLDVQPKLLRFLENAEVLPLGERKPVQVDVRIIAATHRDLLQLVREGKFREDLYYRLQVIPVNIPPLRERREDVVALASFFIRKLTPEGREPPGLSPDGALRLMGHAWPGNVRELRNVIERSLAFEPLPALLTAEHLRL